MGHRRISTASTHTLRVSTLWHRLGLHLPRPEVNVGLAHPSWHASASCGAVRRSRYSWQSGAARLAPDSTRGLLQLSGVRPAENAHSRRDVDRGVSTPSPFSARKSLVHPPRAGLLEEDRSRQAARREQEALKQMSLHRTRAGSGLRTSIQAPQANAFAARWLSTVRRECLGWMPICGRRHLEKVLAEVRRPRHCQAAPSWPRPARARHQGESTRRGQIERASTAERRAWRTDPRA